MTSWKNNKYLPCLLLFLGPFPVYAAAFGHRFLTTWDDNVYVTANEAIRGFTSGHLKEVFTTFFAGNYAPLHLLSYMLDYTLWGLNPAGFIFMNVLLHALNGVLFHRIASIILGENRWAFLAAFIFLFHPVQVESVAWISQRKNVLAMTFFLIAFRFYLRYRDRNGRERRTSYLLSLAAFACALLTKSVTVILPPMLLLYDLCFPPKEPSRNRLLDKAPYLLLAFGAGALTIISQSADAGGGRIAPPENQLSILYTMLPVFARYMGLLFWPAGLSAWYEVPVRHSPDETVVLAGLLAVIVAAAVALTYRRQRTIFFGTCVFVLGLLPVSQLVPIASLINDRYLYFPLLGAALCAGAGASVLWEKRDSAFMKPVLLLLGCAILLLPALSASRTSAWKDDVTLWSDATGKNPGSPLAWTELGSAYHKQGDFAGALDCYRRALEIRPLDFTALKNISLTHLKRREYAEAQGYLLQLVERYPAYAQGFEDLALTFAMAGNIAAAEWASQRAQALDPARPRRGQPPLP